MMLRLDDPAELIDRELRDGSVRPDEIVGLYSVQLIEGDLETLSVYLDLRDGGTAALLVPVAALHRLD